MESKRDGMRVFCILVLYLSIAPTLFTHCDARRSRKVFGFEGSTHPTSLITKLNKLEELNHLDIDTPSDPSEIQSYEVSSPFSFPPLESLAPVSFPQNTPPFCEYPPFIPQPPTTNPSPIIYSPPPPSSPSYPSPIYPIQNPPASPPECSPNLCPPKHVPSPPSHIPSPPKFVPSPPEYIPSPGGFVPSPPMFLPPIVFPPPNSPPSPCISPGSSRWCVAKPSIPEPIIQEAMDYACGSGADCGLIQPNGACYRPDTLFSHASFAFNSYWQKMKGAGGTCDFGGTAMIVTVDPSFDGCHFIIN